LKGKFFILFVAPSSCHCMSVLKVFSRQFDMCLTPWQQPLMTYLGIGDTIRNGRRPSTARRPPTATYLHSKYLWEKISMSQSYYVYSHSCRLSVIQIRKSW
jgi:hypothetical protein